MRILVITPYYYPALKYGGPVKSIHILNKTLVKKGVEVNVLTTNAGLENQRFTDNKNSRYVSIDGVNVKYHRYYGYDEYNFSPQLLLDALKIAKNCDLIFIAYIWNFTVLSGTIAGLLWRKPYIISPRGTLYKEAINIKSKYKKLFYYHMIAKYYLQNASVIHFTTSHEKQKVMDFLKLKCPFCVIPDGLDLSEFKNLPERGQFKIKYPLLKDKRYIIFLGRIDKEKGLDILVNAFKHLSRKYKDLYLVIAGPLDNKEYKKKVEMWLKNDGLLDKVIFTGILIGDDKLSAVIDAELLVLPSYFENFGMVVVEAMACGVPVVITDKVGIYKEVKENNAGVVVKPTYESLLEGMNLLLDNKQLKQIISENGKRLVKNYYDIDKIADKTINFYEEVLKKNKKGMIISFR